MGMAWSDLGYDVVRYGEVFEGGMASNGGTVAQVSGQLHA